MNHEMGAMHEIFGVLCTKVVIFITKSTNQHLLKHEIFSYLAHCVMALKPVSLKVAIAVITFSGKTAQLYPLGKKIQTV